MVGSMERYLTRARAWPSFNSGTGDSLSCKSPGVSNPFGRDCRRSWRLVAGTSEGNVFVGDFRAAARRSATAAVRIVGGRGVALEVVAAGGTRCAATCRGSAFGAAAQHAEIVGDNFKAGALLAFLILPFAGLNAAFDKDQRTFLEILLGDFGLLAPYDDFVPLGALLALAVLVFVGLIRGDREICDGLTAAGVAGFGIAAQTADENDFIHRHKRIPPATAKITCEAR